MAEQCGEMAASLDQMGECFEMLLPRMPGTTVSDSDASDWEEEVGAAPPAPVAAAAAVASGAIGGAASDASSDEGDGDSEQARLHRALRLVQPMQGVRLEIAGSTERKETEDNAVVFQTLREALLLTHRKCVAARASQMQQHRHHERD